MLLDDAVNYVVSKVEVKDQDEGGEFFAASKIIFITWVGIKCKPMVKARSSQHRRPLYQYALVLFHLPSFWWAFICATKY